MTDHQPVVDSTGGARRVVGRVISAASIVAAVIAIAVTLLQWSTRPQTDDATVRANFVGIAPQVSGHIVELSVHDNQQVNKGDPLFVIDRRPYEIALERARATLALTRSEVDGLRNGAATAAAGVSKAQAQLGASAEEVVRDWSRCSRSSSSPSIAWRKPVRSATRRRPRWRRRARNMRRPTRR